MYLILFPSTRAARAFTGRRIVHMSQRIPNSTMVIPIDVRFHYGAPYLQVQLHEHDRPILAESTLLPYEAHGTKRLV
jgi:hypothetical protein